MLNISVNTTREQFIELLKKRGVRPDINLCDAISIFDPTYAGARAAGIQYARDLNKLAADSTTDSKRNFWGSGAENSLSGVCLHIDKPSKCPRCGTKDFVSYSPFPSECGPYVWGAKDRCRKCGWVADDRPDDLQPTEELT